MSKELHNQVPDAEALDLVMQLMALPGGSGAEGQVMRRLVDQLQTEGVPAKSIRFDNAHRRTPINGETGNLIVKLPGVGTARRSPRRMFSAHTDTVPICVGCQPVRRGRVIHSADPKTGLGGDDRAGAAVLLATLMAIQRACADHPPLTFLWTVQEEVGLHGARNVAVGSLGKPVMAFNFDGGSPAKLTIGATGGYRMDIDVTGHASHAGNHPEQGVSAIAIASLAIADLTENGWHGLIEKGKNLGTSNVGVIRGGDATNVVTDQVTLRAEARSHDPKFRERIVREIEKAFTRAAKRVKSTDGKRGAVHFDGQLDYEAFRLAPKNPCVTTAQDAAHAEGVEPELAIANGGLDANWLNAHGIPTVSLGCGQRNIHTVDEQLDIADYQLARRIAYRLASDCS